jgi:Pyruvate/2-oxoacid:ferredoxin oxidoreductase gamma subunit
MVMLGALLDKMPILPLKDIKVSLNTHLPERHKKLLKSNLDALDQGAAFSRGELKVEKVSSGAQEPTETIAPTSV